MLTFIDVPAGIAALFGRLRSPGPRNGQVLKPTGGYRMRGPSDRHRPCRALEERRPRPSPRAPRPASEAPPIEEPAHPTPPVRIKQLPIAPARRAVGVRGRPVFFLTTPRWR